MGISFRPMQASLQGVRVRTGEERATLVRRTYLLVLASVLVTMGGVSFAMGQPALMSLVARHPFLTFAAVLAPLFGAQYFRQAFPANIGLVFLFTFIEGIAISPIIYVYGANNPGVIGEAALLTGSTFGVLTLYAWFSRRDFSAWGGFFMVGLWVLIATALLNLFFQSAVASLWLAGATIFVFSGLLIFDTWRLRNVFGPDDYVLAAVSLYLDLLNIFIAILSLLGGGRRN
jgi:FtsH-binding integral membrane protein